MRLSLLISTATLFWPVALPLHAAGFDCAKAGTWIEKAICADAELDALDTRMSSAYLAAREATKTVDPESHGRIGREQTAWLKRRNQCSNTTCLHRLYDLRIGELAAYAPAGPGSDTSPGGPIEHAQGEIRESDAHYSISAAFPILLGTGAPVESANREIRAVPREYVDAFTKEHREFAREFGAELEGPDWSLNIDFREPYATDRYIAILFGGYDYRGGAHGMPIIEPLVIETADGKTVPPERLFRPGADWLRTLGRRCYAELSSRDPMNRDTDWLKSGTEAKAENYRLLYPGPDGLTVTFPPYTVAPYAAGAQEVLIPYAELSGILDPALFGP